MMYKVYFDKSQMDLWREKIIVQIIGGMQLCLECIEILNEEEKDKYDNEEKSYEYDNIELTSDGVLAANIINNIKHYELTSEVVNAIEILWNESAIKSVYDLRTKFNIMDSCAYFWNNIHRISAKNYMSTHQDILLVY